MGRQRLHVAVRRLPAARRPRRRPRGPEEDLPRRPRSLHVRLAALRDRDGVDVADRDPRPAGPRRCARLTGGTLDRDGDLQGRRRADEGARRLGRDRGRRRRGRPAARRHPRRVPLVALDLLRQRPGRHRRLRPVAAVRAGVARRARPQELRHRRGGRRHGRADRAGLRDRPLGREGLGLGRGARHPRRRGSAPDRVRRDRVTLGRAARPPLDLLRAHDPRGERSDARGRVRAVRDVLLQHAVRAAGARLQPDRGRSCVPALHGRDHHRLGRVAAADPAPRRPRGSADRARHCGDRDAAVRAALAGQHVRRRHPAGDHARLDRDGARLRAADPDRDERCPGRRRRPRVGSLQHLPADRRRARARPALDVRRQQDGRRARLVRRQADAGRDGAGARRRLPHRLDRVRGIPRRRRRAAVRAAPPRRRARRRARRGRAGRHT